MNIWQMVLIGVGAFIMVMMTQVKAGPIRWIGRRMIEITLGALALFVINLFAGGYGFQIPLNLITVAMAGLLGVPGILGLVCIKLFIL
ncbi:pro-sigmaK processing inhibitor BofA family protein [Bacillus horti]|uniref:Inhibitor of the pro-sigma K processing machinery n=1 Tax=Caldalkalibacillus horti TaxID=77523 RepID=A0ABT9W3X0_9BACI|nr:pro-sigmaK processing inhibitor BofA family protein [Bacillus horti]MDQ0167550.1 inhibitor of the pro-sigma K processing machinery [Bacillus horti]